MAIPMIFGVLVLHPSVTGAIIESLLPDHVSSALLSGDQWNRQRRTKQDIFGHWRSGL